MQGLALLCAFVFWTLLAFAARWTIRLHVKAEQDRAQIEIRCGGGLTGTRAVFSFSAGSFAGIAEDAKKIMARRKSAKAKEEAKGKDDANGDSEAKTDKADAGLLKLFRLWAGTVRSVHVKWAQISILLALRRKVKTLLFRLTRKMELKALRVQVSGGTGDAAQTALLSGTLWMGWGLLVAHLNNRLKVTGRDMNLSVLPDYAKPGLNIDVASILRLQTSHIIVKSIQIILWIRRGVRKLK